MGEGTSGLDPEEHLNEVSERIEQSRARLDDLVSELDHRRHLVTNLKRRIIENPLLTLGSAVAAVAAIGGAVALLVHQRRQRQTLGARAARLRTAVGRMIDKPEKVAPSDGGFTGKLLGAAASAATGVLVKRVLESIVLPGKPLADDAAKR
jgi:hypothetical protein